jgi:hypothetical protein
MADEKRGGRFTLVVLLAIVLQVLFIFADSDRGPGKVALKFLKAYYALDKSMDNLLCNEVKLDEEVEYVEQYLDQMRKEAVERGFRATYMRSHLIKAETHTVFRDENRAHVRITGERKRLIHPLFTWIGTLFRIGETYHVDETVSLIKESGEWKVCNENLILSRI